VHNFYKAPKECYEFLNNIKKNNKSLSGYLLSPSKAKGQNNHNTAIVITEEIGMLNNRPIERLHILGGWVFSYWKSRAYLAACASIALNSDIWLIGKKCDDEWLKSFCAGEKIAKYNFNYSGFDFNTLETWYVDEFIEQPEKYLSGIDPEQNNFGLHAAISKWLELEALGFICVDKYNNQLKVRTKFKNYVV